MCGIVAWYNFDWQQPIDRALIQRMVDSLVHRGPDDSGMWLGGAIALGHRRLSIIDLSPAGRGPMNSKDNSLVVTYNGEIFNYRELRSVLEAKGYRFHSRTDTEVILNAYSEWGVECLGKLNGMFAFALWDAKRRRLFVARDRFGVKPLVYYQDSKRFICASEIKALLQDSSIPNELDPVALHHYLSLMTVPAPFTIYRGIRKLPPGHYLIIEDGKVSERCWWTLPLVEETQESEIQILERLDELIADSVRLRLISDAPLGTFLSGGVDSSVISAFSAKQLGLEQLRTFAVTFLNQKDYDESAYATKVAKYIGSNHTEIDLKKDFLSVLPDVVRLFDEPFAISSALALYMMASETSRHVKVVLTGDGGDEVFAGYTHRQTVPDQRFDRLNRIPLSGLRDLNRRSPRPPIAWQQPSWLRRPYQLAIALTTSDDILRNWRYLQMLYIFNEREKFDLYTPEWASQLRQMPDFSSTDHFLSNFFPQHAPNRLAYWRYFDLHTTLANEMLAKVDKATMAWGLEARNPLLDHRLVEYALTIPPHLLAYGTKGKYILKKLAEKYVPKDVLYRPKQGFCVPLDLWFRHSLPPLLQDALASEKIKSEGIFRPEVIKRIIARHQKDQKTDLSHAIYSLACFELWSDSMPETSRIAA